MIPRNLGISRQTAVTAALLGIFIVLAGLVGLVVVYGAGDGLALVGTLLALGGSAITSLVGALKATESADTLGKVWKALQDLHERVNDLDGKGGMPA